MNIVLYSNMFFMTENMNPNEKTVDEILKECN